MRPLATRITVFFGVVALSMACGARTGMIADDEDIAPEADASRPVRDASAPPRDAARDAIPSVDARVDVGIDAAPSPICVPFDAGAGADAGTCSRDVRVTNVVKSGSSCFVDLAFEVGEIGRLRYACGGGSAAMVFSRGTFVGGYDGTNLDVCAGTTFPWSDGCTWDSAQRAFGTMSTGALTFTYTEAPRPGAGCLTPCTATGTVEVF